MDSGAIAWMLVSCALVLLMTPGLAFFYAGLVREREVINTMKMSFIALGFISVEWALLGYSLVFSENNALIGGLGFVALNNVTTAPNPDFSSDIPHLLFMAFQMMFAIITPALISGAVVGRMKFKSYLLFIVAWAILVYNPIAHWVWGPGGWIGEMGALDFAGGTVVHISAGVAALVAALVIGPRHDGESDHLPHNVPFVVLGASLLWFGWFGFNAGSALAADGTAVLALVTTMLATGAAVVAWVLLEMFDRGKPTATGTSIAAVVGLVTITPAAGFVLPGGAMLMGLAGAVASYYALKYLDRLPMDDTLDVFACHGVGGIVGSILTGVFASAQAGGVDGLLYGNADLMMPQVVGVLVVILFTAVMTAAILYAIKAMFGLRSADDTGEFGIDHAEHDERAYAYAPVSSKDQPDFRGH
ncbi:MAG: ammonium transporter [Gammaproteobacteria bacterium]|nr:ammonium transporter [Gammaproteobacteria bacterium]